MKENSPVHQLGNFVDRPWGVSEIGGSWHESHLPAGRALSPDRLFGGLAHHVHE